MLLKAFLSSTKDFHDYYKKIQKYTQKSYFMQFYFRYKKTRIQQKKREMTFSLLHFYLILNYETT